MARNMVIYRENGADVILVYEEGIKQKEIKRDVKQSFHMATMHKTKDGYDFEDQKIKYVKGEKQNVK